MHLLHFTPHEAEALRHRLDAADCIADVFADTEDLAYMSRELVEETARRLSIMIGQPLQVDPHDPLTREILMEAVEGSTWNGVHDSDEVSPQRRAAARRALQSAADKIAQAFGVPALSVPEA